MTADLISTNASFILLAFAPPILWLIFYLREDQHPEPKLLLLLTFIGGMAGTIVALFAECAFAITTQGSCAGLNWTFGTFLAIAAIEEIVKYAPVRLFVINHPDFNEPIDAMIYMMTAGLGFAALENALFSFRYFYDIALPAASVFSAAGSVLSLVPLSQKTFLGALDLATKRFVGANLLHALSSGIVGYFLARAFFSPRRHHFVALGLGIATIFHALFNYLVVHREMLLQGTFCPMVARNIPILGSWCFGVLRHISSYGTLYLILLLSTMATMVFIELERLKKSSTASPETTPSAAPPQGV